MTNIQPTTFNDYILDFEIGRDDLTIIYKARKQEERTVAIKVIAPQFRFDKQFVTQFTSTCRNLIQLEHPHIIRTSQVYQMDDMVYVVQTLVDDPTLTELLEIDGTFSAKRTLKLARQIASALDYAHQHKIIHGDLSTNTIYIGANDQITMVNFGYTQAMQNTSLVKKGYPLGTPETMAPELLRDQTPTPQADLYALGIICYQMLTNTPPFTGTLPTIMHAHAYEIPRPLNLLNPTIPIEVSQVIERMLAKEPEARYQTGADFITEFTAAVEATTSAPVSLPIPSVSTGEDTTSASPPIRYSQMTAEKNIPTKRLNHKITRPARTQLWISLGLIISASVFFVAWSLGMVSVWQISQAAQIEPTTVVEVSSLPTVTPTTPPSPTATSITKPTPTIAALATAVEIVNLPTPGEPTIAENSPFTNLVLAQKITQDNRPNQTGTSFVQQEVPLYLFFDYDGIDPGTTWGHRWRWANSDIANFQAIWSEEHGLAGTAWVFYNPEGGYQPGPYQVTLLVEGRTVATATFVILAE